MELSSSNITKVLIFSQKKASLIFSQKESFSYISDNRTLHFSVQAREIEKNPSGKNFLYFRRRKSRKISCVFSKESFSYIPGNGNPDKISYISGNGTFLYFRK